MKWFNRKILFLFAGSSILWQITYIGCEFAVLRFVDPELIGIWQLVLLIQSYSAISKLGIINAMNREFPFFLGQKNEEKANDIHQTTFAFVLLNGLVLSLFFIGLAFYFQPKGTNWIFAFGAMGVIIFFEFVSNYFEATLRGVNKFLKVSRFQIILIPIAITSLFFPWKYDFVGLCIRASIVSGAKFIILFFIVNKYLSIPKFQFPTFKHLFNIGWRLWIWNYLKNFSKSFPRLILATFSGTTLLGFYAPINWINMVFTSLSSNISSYIYPNLSYSLAEKESAIGSQALQVAKYTLLIFLPMTIIGVILIPYLIPIFLPKYAIAIPAMQISLVAGLFDSINLATTAFATLKAWKPMFDHVGITIILKGIFILLGYFLMEDKLLGVSIGLCISCAILFGITWKMVRDLDKNLK
jgi:O-antigen/teichoic acid export membrane protein